MKKRECIVHIGMHKTGSSSIQQTLSKALKDKNFSYLDLGIPNHSRVIVSLFESNTVKRNLMHIKRGLSKKEIAKFNNEMEDKLNTAISKLEGRTAIISGEEIRNMTEGGLRNFRDFLTLHFDTITVVAYVRSPKGYMESAFQQVVKGGFGDFKIEKLYPNYRKFISIEKIFGQGNLRLWKFDPSHFPNKNVVSHFCSSLDIKMKARDTIRTNESLSKEALSLLYIYRKYGPEFGRGPNVIKENAAMIRKLQQIGGHKIRFSPSLIKPIIEKNRDDIKWIEWRLGTTLLEPMEELPYDISSEDDLLTVSPETIDKLRSLVGLKTSLRGGRSDIEEIVELMDRLKRISKQGIKSFKNRKEEIEMEMQELVKSIKEENKEELGKMPNRRIAFVIKKVLEKINEDINRMEEGKYQIPGLGVFVVQKIEKKGEAEKIGTSKRIIFRPRYKK